MGMPHGEVSIATAGRAAGCPVPPDGTIADPMFKSLIRTIRGPSRDPRMAYITRPLPRYLPDEQVVAALDIAMAENPDPGYLVETLPAALRQVSGHDYQVLDRTTGDVTGAYRKTQVMIRDGEVGLWPGYKALAYPLLARSRRAEEARAAITAADHPEQADAAPSPTSPVGKPGWAPPAAVAGQPDAGGGAQAAGEAAREDAHEPPGGGEG